MDTQILLIAALVAIGLLAVLLFVAVGRSGRSQAELAGRLAQLADGQAASQNELARRLLDQERMLGERLDGVATKVGESIEKSSVTTQQTMSQLRERLAVMDQAQLNITQLSTQMVGLQDILSNKQARGAFGEIQLNDLVSSVLPPSSYEFQATIGGGARADCLIILPNPPGPIAIDSKFPLEAYRRLANAAPDAERKLFAAQFETDVLKHVKDIAAKYIVPGETAEAALMFVPSEAVYAEIHSKYERIVEQSFRQRVFIVSPTTLWATLNTVRAIFKDVRMREQASLIQKEVSRMLDDIARLLDRVDKLDTHFGQTRKDLDDIKISANKVGRTGEKIQSLELQAEADTAAPAAGIGASGGGPANGGPANGGQGALPLAARQR
ncbi:MAG: DNA recombination protein RmuC [Alphaproteobacteria bacterium]